MSAVDDEPEYLPGTPGGTRRRTRSADRLKDPKSKPPRRYDYDVVKFTLGLARAFLVCVPEEEDLEVSRKEVQDGDQAFLLRKMKEYENAARIDKDWTVDVDHYLGLKGVKEGLAWTQQDDDCLTAIRNRFASATPGKIAPVSLPTPPRKSKRKSARKRARDTG